MEEDPQVHDDEEEVVSSRTFTLPMSLYTYLQQQQQHDNNNKNNNNKGFDHRPMSSGGDYDDEDDLDSEWNLRHGSNDWISCIFPHSPIRP